VLTLYDLPLWIPESCLWFQYLREKLARIDHPGNQSLLRKTTNHKGFFVNLQGFLLLDPRLFFVHSPLSPASTLPRGLSAVKAHCH
jgi:hypothetical protein